MENGNNMDYLKKQRTKKTYKQKSFSPTTIEQAMARDLESCRICGVCVNLDAPHHIFARSELYNDIINRVENCAIICRICHNAITNPTESNKGKEYDKQLKQESIKEFKENGVSDEELRILIAAYRSKYGALHMRV